MSQPRRCGRRTFLTELSDLGMAGLIGSTWRPSRLQSPVPAPAPESLARREPRLRLRLDRLTCPDFARHVGDPFLVTPDSGSALALTLNEAKLLGSRPVPVPGLASRPPFSVVFHAPAESRLEQGTYRVQHSRLGTLDLFLVPIGPRTADDVTRYEAIFG